ncbi:hypothetical protein B0J12DRAFT_735033 [Macrophomina phaseolina]|uniref:DUF7708 domain-containing protein n=1 Tax=Macrophomina phaseolina TaxID=35725 RepID=A0ABQ8GU85_9PEZI|nr:hypothetical protein B0J12DRAFT_735033 [Macrophomina phaseolina]
MKAPDVSGEDILSAPSDEEATKESVERDLCALQQQAQAELSNSENSLRELEQRRKKGVHSVGSELQGFLNCFADFLSGYSGIAECAKAADNQFGGLAYGTLSIFLRVASRKQEREEMLESQMREINRYFPRLNDWQSIYPDETLKDRILDVFADITIFARRATEYYQYSSWRRTADAARVKGDIEVKVKEIREKLPELRADCEVRMQKKIHELAQAVKSLEERLQRKDKEEDTRNLATLHQAIGVAKIVSNQEEEIRNLDEVLRYTFQPTGRPALGRMMTWEMLLDDHVFAEWLKGRGTGMLVLSGNNDRRNTLTTLSWLSTAATLLVSRLHKQTPVVPAFCQKSAQMHDDFRPSLKLTIAQLVYRLAIIRPEFLRAHGVEINGMIHGEEWNSDEQEVTLKAAFGVLEKMLSAFTPEETVYIVLDRPDKCFFDQYELHRDLHFLLSSLVTTIGSVPSKVKVLVIVGPFRPSFSTVSDFLEVGKRESLARLYMERLGWHQSSF